MDEILISIFLILVIGFCAVSLVVIIVGASAIAIICFLLYIVYCAVEIVTIKIKVVYKLIKKEKSWKQHRKNATRCT